MTRIAIALVLSTLPLAVGAARGGEPQDFNPANTLGANSIPASPVRAEAARKVSALQSFTHFARIPVDSDAGTIRFEKAKPVRVPTTIAYTMNQGYCEEVAFRDPGGSAYCPYAETGSPATAYEVTYSFVGQPVSSDESGSRNFTFQVYFRPDELDPDARQALSARKPNRADLAAYFTVSVDREATRRMVVDEAQSHFCDGNFVDGAWVRSDRNCQDEVRSKAVAALPDYLTVRVDPVSRARIASASAATIGKK